MPTDLEKATEIVNQQLPGWDIQAVVEYQNLFLFQVFSQEPEEEEMDPFFSVNKETGEFRDFSIITDGDTAEIARLFLAAKKK